MMELIILFLFLLYYALIVLFWIGWRQALQPKPRSDKKPFISVLIPARNEEMIIHQVLQDLKQQDYPGEQVEIIVIDDHSEDQTFDSVEQWKTGNPAVSLSILSLNKTSGKKAGITEGVKHAQGEIIMCTDADCRIPKQWLSGTVDLFTDRVHMVIGPVRLADTETLVGSCQQLEFMPLVAAGAATLSFGIPTMCNGANMAYRKQAFESVRGYEGNEGIASGDDEFLLRRILSHYPGGVVFTGQASVTVSAAPANSMGQFMQQRIRWAGKWRSHGFGFSFLLALLIFCVHLAVLVAAAMSMLGYISPWISILILFKAVLEYFYLQQLANFFHIRFRFVSFLVLQIVYPVYVIFFGLTANFLRAEWKNRRI
jgi:poly-beta-1,6-N-acetyl-D-glucosamine synthase